MRAAPILKATTAFLSIVSSQPLWAQQGAEDLLSATAARYQRVEALCADFTQHLSVPLLGDERTGHGRLCQSRPNLFAMRFTDPDGDAVVVDGESAWVFFPSLDDKQVFKAPVDQTAAGHDFHREFLVNPEEKYVVEDGGQDEVDGVTLRRLRLTPIARAPYRGALLWIDEADSVLRQIRIEEENGTLRTITLRDVDLEASPGAEWFSFTPPPGALVISR